MSKCWMKDSGDRPQFTEISEFMEKVLLNQDPGGFATEDDEGIYSYARNLTRAISADYLNQEDPHYQNDYVVSPDYIDVLPVKEDNDYTTELAKSDFSGTSGTVNAAVKAAHIEPLPRAPSRVLEKRHVSSASSLETGELFERVALLDESNNFAETEASCKQDDSSAEAEALVSQKNSGEVVYVLDTHI